MPLVNNGNARLFVEYQAQGARAHAAEPKVLSAARRLLPIQQKGRIGIIGFVHIYAEYLPIPQIVERSRACWIRAL